MFSYGFEDGRTKEQVGTLIGFLGDPSYVSIQETSAFNGTGRKYGQVNADATGFRDRGFNVDLNLIPGLNLDDFWFGAYVQVLSALGSLGLTRIFGITGPNGLHLDVAVNAGSLTDSVIVRRAETTAWTALSMGTSSWVTVGTSGTDKRFSTSESVLDPDNSWRFVAVNIKIAQEKILVYVDDQLWIETTGTNLYSSNTFDRVLFTAYRGANEAASGPSVVNHDDLWVANEYKIQPRSIPIDMGDVGFFDQATPSDATPIEELVNYPFDTTTYATVEQGDYLSFKLDDSFLVESNATKIGSIKCTLGVSGPGTFTVFLFDGQTKKYMEELSVGGISVQYLDIEFSQNPFTEAPFELEDVKNIEIGIFNGPMPPEPATPEETPVGVASGFGLESGTSFYANNATQISRVLMTDDLTVRSMESRIYRGNTTDPVEARLIIVNDDQTELLASTEWFLVTGTTATYRKPVDAAVLLDGVQYWIGGQTRFEADGLPADHGFYPTNAISNLDMVGSMAVTANPKYRRISSLDWTLAGSTHTEVQGYFRCYPTVE